MYKLCQFKVSYYIKTPILRRDVTRWRFHGFISLFVSIDLLHIIIIQWLKYLALTRISRGWLCLLFIICELKFWNNNFLKKNLNIANIFILFNLYAFYASSATFHIQITFKFKYYSYFKYLFINNRNNCESVFLKKILYYIL